MTNFYLLVRRSFSMILLLGSTIVWAQNRTVTGNVTSSDDGAPLPGVNIVEKGTNNGSITDASGNFSINVPDGAVLVFSFVGYTTLEVAVQGRSSIDVTLQADVTALSEVVVIGYGEQQRKDLTGSVVAIGSENFNKGVFTSPQDLLLGKVAGVQITSTGGAPGSGSVIRIRGGSSVLANNDPLIVIDGFPVDNNSISGLSNPLAAINPNDIESFTVLKDASATAIYGSRASNGVILITTKKGKSGKPQLSYEGQVSLSKPIDFIDVLSADEYRDLATSLEGTLGIDQVALDRLGSSNTNWQEEVFRDAWSHNHSLGLSGTTQDVPYRVSYGYTDQQGILKTTSMQRHSLNVNVNPSFLDDHLKVNASVKGMFSKHNFGDQGAVGSAVSFDPTQPIRNGNTRYGGFFAWVADPTDPNSDPNTIAPRNPVARLELTDNRSEVYRIIGNLQLDYRFPFLPELRANVNLGIDNSDSEGFNNTSKFAPWTSNQGILTDYTGENKSKLFDIYLNYVKQLGAHKVDVMAGHSYQSFSRDGSNFSRNVDETVFSDFDVDFSDGSDIDGDTIPRQFVPNPNVLISFFGRLNYSFKEKYLVTATFRTDGSSRFSEDNRWGVFPALALAWRVSEESFLQNIAVLSDLKLRLGYGVTGQQDIGSTYPYLPVYLESTPTAAYQFGNSYYNTFRPGAYDADIKWEETTTYNAGFDLGFWENRLTASFDYYHRETKDLINRIPIAAGSNFNNFLTTNVGNVENKGFEIMLNAQAIKTADITWDIGFNLSHNSNKITRLTKTNDPNYPGVATGGIAGGVGNMIQVHRVGYPASSFYVFEQVYDTEGKPIEGLYVDRTGEGGNVASNNLNKYPYHSPAPDVLLGLNSTFRYKQFDLFLSGRASFGNYVYNNGASGTHYQAIFISTGFFNNLRRSIYDTEFTTTQYFSDHYVENASFFKMDNISFGYNFDQLANQKLKARLSFTVQNAFIITDYTGLDPEVSNGIDNNLYPRPRVFMFGVNLTY